MSTGNTSNRSHTRAKESVMQNDVNLKSIADESLVGGLSVVFVQRANARACACRLRAWVIRGRLARRRSASTTCTAWLRGALTRNNSSTRKLYVRRFRMIIFRRVGGGVCRVVLPETHSFTRAYLGSTRSAAEYKSCQISKSFLNNEIDGD